MSDHQEHEGVDRLREILGVDRRDKRPKAGAISPKAPTLDEQIAGMRRSYQEHMEMLAKGGSNHDGKEEITRAMRRAGR